MHPSFISSLRVPIPSQTLGENKCRSHHGSRRLSIKLKLQGFNTTNENYGERVELTQGDIIAVIRSSSGKAELGVVTGTDSAGRNVDFIPLKPLVDEMYVRDGTASTFIRSSKVRKVPSTYAEDQDGWIVLNSDVVQAEDFISNTMNQPATVDVKAPPPSKPLTDIPKREAFRPTRAQAFIGALISIPFSACSYAVFSSERTSFVGQENDTSMKIALVIPALLSVLSLIVGLSLAIYGLNLSEDEDKSK